MLRIALYVPLVSVGALAGSNYSVVVITPPNGFTNVTMVGINNAGQTAGTGTVAGNSQAFVGSPTGSVPIPLPAGWTSSEAAGINASGQIAGSLLNATARQAFIGTPSGAVTIPLPSGCTTALGLAINDLGQVAGTASGQIASLAFIGTTTSSIAISPPFENAEPFAMNNSGQVAGAILASTFLSGSAGIVTNSTEFLGSTSGITNVPPQGFANPYPRSLNNLGQIAGVSSQSQFYAIPDRAFFGTASSANLLPLPVGAQRSSVGSQALNDSTIVVGSSDAGGWIWDSTTGTRLLNGLVSAGWTVSNALSISNNGVILAQASFQGGDTQYVELAPSVSATPAPSTFVLVLLGATLLAGWLTSLRTWEV